MFLPFLMLAAAAPISIIVAPVVNMHSRPSEDADVVSQAIYSTPVSVLTTEDNWTRVRTPDNYEGWLRSAALFERTAGPYAAAGRVARIDSVFANLYREPDATRHRPLLTLPYEVRLEVASEPADNDGRWIQVRLADERTAWVQRGDVSFDHSPLSVEDLVALALRFRGLPYLWGGTSSFGFDCSGFTQLLGRRRGLSLPRDSGPQFRWEGATPVAPGELQAGDLLFFGEQPDRVSHTGMYIGGGEFIHATTWLRPTVQVSRLDDPHWQELLLGCRRPR
jgi:cell wall-associated NlpC family hydrolase